MNPCQSRHKAPTPAIRAPCCCAGRPRPGGRLKALAGARRRPIDFAKPRLGKSREGVGRLGSRCSVRRFGPRGERMAGEQEYDVFLSYAHADGPPALQLDQWLRDQGLRTFFDRSELRPGLRWVAALEEAIGRAGAMALLVGPHGLGNTQQYERELALVRQAREPGFPVIPVLLPGCAEPPTGFLELLTWVDLREGAGPLDQPAGLQALLAAIRREAAGSAAVRGEICPYMGLEPFREEDAGFFCGREVATRELVAKVHEHAFIAVVGRSGSGKSSLVYAGLMPALRRLAIDRRQADLVWDMVSLRPGKWPLRALAACFGTVPE